MNWMLFAETCRVLILSTEEAKEGMKLAAPVLHPAHPDQELLRAGYVIEPQIIPRLIELGVTCVFVDYPGLDDLDKHLAAFLSPARQTLFAQMKKTITAGENRTRPAVSYHDYYSTTRDLVTTLLSQGQHPIFLDQMARLGTDAVGHAMAVAHLSLLLGIKLESYLIDERKRLAAARAKDIVSLGVAGMLHDLGKYELPEHLWHCSEIDPPANAGDLEQWRTHPRVGYEMVRNGVEATAASAVLQHHQHFDGSGFPSINPHDHSRKLDGKRIHIFARIIRAADLYDRLATGDKRGRRSNVEVLHLLTTKYSGWLDPAVLHALMAVAPPFPPGSKLRLEDGSEAVVMRVDGEDPYHPIVRRVVGESWTLSGDLINLANRGAPAIASIGAKPIAAFVPA